MEATTAEPRRWFERGLCNDYNVTATDDPWYPEDRDNIHGSYETARKICNACPVREQCLRDALDFEKGRAAHKIDGMRGGLTPGERYRIQRPGYTLLNGVVVKDGTKRRRYTKKRV